jgi:uncharacterized protein
MPSEYNREVFNGEMIAMVYHRHDEDPKMRPAPITPEKREDIIVHMAAGLVGTYRYVREHRKTNPSTASAPESSEVGRNDACPCGSGKKYKSAAAERRCTELHWVSPDL